MRFRNNCPLREPCKLPVLCIHLVSTSSWCVNFFLLFFWLQGVKEFEFDKRREVRAEQQAKGDKQVRGAAT